MEPLATASPPHLQGICELTLISSVGLPILQLRDTAQPLRTNALSKPVSMHEVAERWALAAYDSATWRTPKGGRTCSRRLRFRPRAIR